MKNCMMEHLTNMLKTLTTEELEELKERVGRKTGYEKPKNNEEYFLINNFGEVEIYNWEEAPFDEEVFKTGNIFTIEEVAENEARARKLMARLKRHAMTHNKEKIDWNNKEKLKWHIFIDEWNNLNVGPAYYKGIAGAVYFTEEETAEKALEEFREELEWYFEEYLQEA